MRRQVWCCCHAVRLTVRGGGPGRRVALGGLMTRSGCCVPGRPRAMVARSRGVVGVAPPRRGWRGVAQGVFGRPGEASVRCVPERAWPRGSRRGHAPLLRRSGVGELASRAAAALVRYLKPWCRGGGLPGRTAVACSPRDARQRRTQGLGAAVTGGRPSIAGTVPRQTTRVQVACSAHGPRATSASCCGCVRSWPW